VEIGEAELAARPELAGRVRGIAGDLFTSELPPEYDVITMCRSAMDWGDERMGPIYAKIRGALPRAASS
jgi:hypothetical protein